MENRNITDADATIICVVEDLYPAGFKFEQFSTDAMGAMGDEAFAETRMGVDGQMVAGYVDQIKSFTITLEPSSPSIAYLNTLMKAERSNRKKYWLTITVNLPALKKTYVFRNGVMKQGKQIPDMQRVLAPQQFVFDFEKID